MNSNEKNDVGGQFYNQSTQHQQQYLNKIERSGGTHNQQNPNNIGSSGFTLTSPRHAIGGISGVVNNNPQFQRNVMSRRKSNNMSGAGPVDLSQIMKA